MKRMRTAVLGLLAAVCAAGCGKSDPSVETGTIVYGRGADSKSLDPQAIEDGESVNVVSQIFDTLVAFEAGTTRVEPALATSWTASADGLSWEFAIRPGVQFHDGTACDAAAIAWNFRRLLDSKSPDRHGMGEPPYGFLYEGIEGCEARGAAVVFTLKAPNAAFLANLAMFPASISSPAAVGQWKSDYGRHPVGTGPFRFGSWAPNQKIVLEANAGHWGGAPKAAKVIFAVIPENSVRLQRLKAGELHIIDGVSPSEFDGVRAEASLRLLLEPGMNFSYLAFNTEREPWNRPEVRRAVASALDKKEIIALAYSGAGTPAVNPLPPTIWGWNGSIQDRPYDPAGAKKALADLGVAGKELDLYVMPNPRGYVPNPANVGAVVKQRLEAAGLKPRLLSPPWEGGLYVGELKEGKHDIALIGWITDNGDPDNFLFTLFHSSAIPDQNHARYRSAEFDDLVSRAQRETAPEKRAELYRRAQERIFEDAPILPLVYMPNVAAVRANVEGYVLHPMGLVRLKGVSLKK
ncbi:MAG: ABC transporter substrate-binding protein [Candidatus Brocadiae bacterium]|nr:ABC transporter substrate-binding protein [Candidatus Brocadiia bacterium]